MQRLQVLLIVWMLCGLSLTACSQAAPASAVAEPDLSTATVSAIPPTATPTQTHTPSPTQPVETPTPEWTAAPTATETPALPEEYFITEISGRKQHFPLGCEASVSADLAAYYGITINEFEFQHRLPLSDNPELGFVGSVNSPWGQIPPYGYGVHAAPIAALLNEYGLPARAYKNYTLDQVKTQLAAGNPLIAWVIGNMVGGVPAEYTDKSGHKVVVAAYEHVVILTGYSKDRIRYMNNGRFFEVPYDVFLNSWGVLENMVVVAEN